MPRLGVIEHPDFHIEPSEALDDQGETGQEDTNFAGEGIPGHVAAQPRRAGLLERLLLELVARFAIPVGMARVEGRGGRLVLLQVRPEQAVECGEDAESGEHVQIDQGAVQSVVPRLVLCTADAKERPGKEEDVGAHDIDGEEGQQEDHASFVRFGSRSRWSGGDGRWRPTSGGAGAFLPASSAHYCLRLRLGSARNSTLVHSLAIPAIGPATATFERPNL